MKAKENIKMQGSFLIEARDAKTGKLLKVWRLKNTLTNINRTIRSQMLMGTYTGGNNALAIKYFALGNGNTSGSNAPSPTDTRLNNEVFRKQITQITNPSIGVVQSVVSLGTQEANYSLTEIGVFCGDSATSATNSGTLLSRIAFSFQKNSNIILNIVRTDTCTIN